MKRYFGLALFLGVALSSLHAQTVNTTVCDVLNNPKAFDGKMVQIKGTVTASFDQFVLTDGSCGHQQVNAIWLAYPEGSKAKAGALVTVEIQPAKSFAGKVEPVGGAAVTLQKDKEFKQFDSALSQWHHSDNAICLGCPKYTVEATVVGRLDGVNSALLERDGKGNITGIGGFGNGNAYPARLVIQSVSGVTKTEVDYSKAEAAVKPKNSAPAPPAQASSPDPMGKLEKLSAAMAASPTTTQIQKDVAVLPKGKEQSANGVTMNYSTSNEPAPRTASAQDSPKGVVVNTSINRGKLDEMGQEMALIYAAQQVEDALDPPPSNFGAPYYIQANNAWAVAATIAVSSGERALILPGGYVIWNGDWAANDRVSNMTSGLNDFLSKEENLSK